MAASSCPLGLGGTKPAPAASGGEARNDASGQSSASSTSTAQASQKSPGLSSEREVSTIPSADGSPFMYPSEKQFFASATAKGHTLDPQDMSMVIAIHNAVNERTWQEILKYEGLHRKECAEPKLLRFLGRPGELTPKARLTSFFGRTLPFDRHDWHVDRCGKHVRYVVDFYDGQQSPTHAVSIHIDARPEASRQHRSCRVTLEL
ncbi:cchl [Symbiodinium sp. CCMP2456]|nr:cchl [Symbiodinium sp. CCMP2456]